MAIMAIPQVGGKLGLNTTMDTEFDMVNQKINYSHWNSSQQGHYPAWPKINL